MQRVIVFLFVSIFFSLVLTNYNECSAQRATINVVVNSRQPIPVGETIYVEGSFSAFNPFYNDKIPLIQSADGSFIYSFIFPLGTEVEFNFTRGFEGSEEVDQNKQAIGKRKFIAGQAFQTQNFTVEKWKDLTSKPFQPTIVIGAEEIAKDLPEPDRLRVHKNLKGNGLSERNVFVWLPPNYHIDNFKRYPVIYIHQNHAVFNPSYSDNNKDWKIDEIADEMNNSGDGYILVSIDNRNDKSFAVNDASVINPYLTFVSQLVKPLIDSKYRTSNKSSETINIGSGVGGSVSFALSAQYPERFGTAICISPNCYFPEDYLHLGSYIKSYKSQQARFIIEGGSSREEYRYSEGAKSLHQFLLNKGYSSIWLKENTGEYSRVNWENRIRNLLFQL